MAVDSFARLLLFKILKGGITPPSSDKTTSEEYNALVDRVTEIDNTLFVSGYDLMAVKMPTTKVKMVRSAVQSSYVPENEYKDLELRVSAIEAFLTVDGGQLMQAKEEGSDDIQPVNLPYAEGDYVNKEEFEALVAHVDEIEKMLIRTAENIFAVRS